jgi:hypothetical protein
LTARTEDGGAKDEMALRAPFALINSEFNDFLFAPIGDEGTGMTLSVFSALARLDIDPWREAARLADLPKETAIQAFTPTIANLRGGQWMPANAREIATRLIAFLPQRGATVAPSDAVAPHASGTPNSRAILLVIYLIFLAAASYLMGTYQMPPVSADPAPPGISGSE